MRYDVVIIFPHGIQYFDEMLKILYKYPDLELLYFRQHTPYDFVQFIEDVYKTDTVPWAHIKGKTEYLKGIGKDLWVMLIKNHKPEEVIVGEGEYAHPQCMLINRFKWEVREKFNPVIKGQRSEQHIIHVTDYESQARILWNKLGFHPIDVIDVVNNPEFPHLPFFVGPVGDYEVKMVDLDKLLCYQMHETEPNYRVPIKESIYYKYVIGDKQPYIDYWDKFKGNRIWVDNSPMKYDKLIKGFDTEIHTREYLMVSNKDVVIDGNHRASILLANEITRIPAIIKEWH